MSIGLDDLCRDLRRQTHELERVLDHVADDWSTPTPAPGWTVRDQITHLAYFDDMTVMAVVDPHRFVGERDARPTGTDALTGSVARRFADVPGPDVREWFGRARARLVDVLGAADPRGRVPWYGPDMSAASVATARIMETFAHGQDVADALEVRYGTTDALTHVAHLGVAARAFSFEANGLPPPDVAIRVELAVPGGGTWVHGEAGAEDRVTGPALDFCFVVTQRRHLTDTALEVSGDAARSWMTVAQCFAGSPGPGRAPGQFP